MTNKNYSYEYFFEVKNNNTFDIDDSLKESIDKIIKIIDNNYGISYHEKNNKNYKYKKQKHITLPNNVMDQSKWRLKKTIINKSINCDLDKYKYEINSLLNKMSPKNFDIISEKILEYYDKELTKDDVNELILNFIDSIFTKAVMQPIYCPYYVKFLNTLDNKYNILELINDKCNKYHEIFDKKIEQKENMTEQELYDKFCNDNLEKVFKAGYSQFIGELYNNNMIQIDIVKNNIDIFVNNLEKMSLQQDKFENIIICITKLITTTSTKLKIEFKFKSVYDSIHKLYKSYNDNKRLKFKLLDLCDYIEKLI
jgi:hypothetical protein